jgi:hypothetical protein
MNEMLAWLDDHLLKPVEFKIAMTGVPGIAFNIRFQREEEARLFETAFA